MNWDTKATPDRLNYRGSVVSLVAALVLDISGLTLQERVAVLVRVARNSQLVADGLAVNVRDVANLGDLPVAHVKVGRILAVEHRDNELTVRQNLAIPLHGYGAVIHDHVVVTEHETQSLSAARLDQGQGQGGAVLGLNRAHLVATPCADDLGSALGRLGHAIGG